MPVGCGLRPSSSVVNRDQHTGRRIGQRHTRFRDAPAGIGPLGPIKFQPRGRGGGGEPSGDGCAHARDRAKDELHRQRVKLGHAARGAVLLSVSARSSHRTTVTRIGVTQAPSRRNYCGCSPAKGHADVSRIQPYGRAAWATTGTTASPAKTAAPPGKPVIGLAEPRIRLAVSRASAALQAGERQQAHPVVDCRSPAQTGRHLER